MLILNKYEKIRTTNIARMRARLSCAFNSYCCNSDLVFFCKRLILIAQISLLTGKNNNVAKIKKDNKKYIFKADNT